MTGNIKNKKVFHGLVNYGTQSGIFANKLRENNIYAQSVTFQDPFKRQTDIVLKGSDNFITKIYFYVLNLIIKINCFFKFDIFHFYYGKTLLPNQIDLYFYKLLGKKVIMEYLGNDIQLYGVSKEKYKFTNVTHMMTEDEGLIADQNILKRFSHEKKYIDKTYVCAPLYSEFAENSEVIPLAIDINQFNYTPLPPLVDNTIKIMHAPTHRGFKGTSFIIEAIEKLKLEGFQIELDLVEGVTHQELINRYKNCHLFIDQILGGWYGTATIEAMAIGRPTMVFLREEYFDYINWGKEIPIINVNPDTFYNGLKQLLINNPFEQLNVLGVKSRNFIETFHDADLVTQKLIKDYQKLISSSN